MLATKRTWRKVMCSTGANRRKRLLGQTLSPIFTRQRASRNFSGCWMKRLRRDETTVQKRRRRKMGHSTEAPRIHPRKDVCVCARVRVCVCAHTYVLMCDCEMDRVKSVFEQMAVDVTGHCMCWCEHVCDF